MVSIDTVYQRVLAIANKEQRGYITPQEFNLLANQAQMAIFNNYFSEMNQITLLPGNETEYSDAEKTLNEKISIFKKVDTSLIKSGSFFKYPNDMYKLGTLYYVPSSLSEDDSVEIQEIDYDEFLDYNQSPLTNPDRSHPLYIRREEGIRIFSTPAIASGVVASYIRRPSKVEWGYVVVNEQALYNASSTDNFELHASEEVSLVTGILGLAGVVIQRQDLMAVGGGQQQA